MNAQLLSKLKLLRLSGLASTLEVRLTEASGNQLNHEEFLELVINDELAVRDDRAITRRIKKADFRELKSIVDFDFSFNPSIKRRQIMEIATGRFIREKADLLILGPPGVGKSHLVQSIGHQAARIGFSVLYRSIFRYHWGADRGRELRR
jgi:DNA replication protein DnaC